MLAVALCCSATRWPGAFKTPWRKGLETASEKQLAAGPASRMEFGRVGVLVAARVRLPCGLSGLGRWSNRLCAQSVAD